MDSEKIKALEFESGEYRFERKYRITSKDARVIAHRLSNLLEFDVHTDKTGHYTVRSLYFDNFYNTSLIEKVDGLSTRAKYRIRLYDGETSLISLEKKEKLDNMTRKTSVKISKEQCQMIMNKKNDWMIASGNPLLVELFHKMKLTFEPKCIVEYDRQIFINDAGNVRITLDKNIRSTDRINEFLLKKTSAVSVPIEDYAVLEVKYDNFLPSHIRNAVQFGTFMQEAVSKYVLARAYYLN